MRSKRFVLALVVVYCAGCQIDPEVAAKKCNAYKWQAYEAMKQKDYSQAEKFYQLALEQAHRSGDVLQSPRVLHELGQLYLTENKLSDAESCFKKSIADSISVDATDRLLSSDKLPLREARVQTMEDLANLLSTENKSPQAEELYKTAIKENSDFGGTVERTLSLNQGYSKLLRSLHRNSEAEQIDIQSNATNTPLKSFDEEMMSARTSEPNEDLAKLRSLVVVANRSGDSNKLWKAWNEIGIAQFRRMHLQEAEDAFRKSLSVLDDTPSPKTLADVKPDHQGASLSPGVSAVSSSLAACLESEGKVEEAQLYYKHAMGLNKIACAFSLSSAALFLTTSHRDKAANQICARALNILESLRGEDSKTAEAVASSWRQLGDVRSIQHLWHDAASCYRRALALFEQHAANNKSVICSIYSQLACSYLEMGKTAESESLLEKAISVSGTAIESKSQLLATFHVLSQIYRARGDFAKSEALDKREISMLEQAHDTTQLPNLLQTLAHTYRDGGRFAEAELLDQRTIALCEKAHDTPHLISVLLELAQSYQRQGLSAKAEPLCQRASSLLETVRDPREQAEFTRCLANIRLTQHQFAEAESLYLKAIKMSGAINDTSPLINRLCELADLYQRRGQTDKAIPLYERASKLLENLHDRSRRGDVSCALARIYQAKGRFADAQSLYILALPMFEGIRTAQQIAAVQCELAETYVQQGRSEEADRVCNSVLDSYEKGHNTEAACRILDELVSIADRKGQYAQAEIYLKKKLVFLQKEKGSESKEAALALLNLGVYYRDHNQCTEAESLFNQVIPIYEKIYGANTNEVCFAFHCQARNYRALKNYIESEKSFQRALEIYERKKPAEVPEILAELIALSELAGEHGKTESYLKRQLSFFKTKSADSKDTAGALLVLANFCRDHRRSAEAQSFYARATELFSKLYGPNSAELAFALHCQARNYRALHNDVEADKCYRSALKIYEKLKGPKDPLVQEIRAELGHE